MKIQSLFLAFPLLLVGCQSVQTIIVQPDPEQPPVVTIENKTVGRTCIYTTAIPDEHGNWTIESVSAQDGVTDFGVGRFGAFIGDILGNTPFVGRNSTMNEPLAPDEGMMASACASFFQNGIANPNGNGNTED